MYIYSIYIRMYLVIKWTPPSLKDADFYEKYSDGWFKETHTYLEWIVFIQDGVNISFVPCHFRDFNLISLTITKDKNAFYNIFTLSKEDETQMTKTTVGDPFAALCLLGKSYLNYAYFVEVLRKGGLRTFFVRLSREHVSMYTMSIILTKKNMPMYMCMNTIASYCDFHNLMNGVPFDNMSMIIYSVLKDAYPWFKLLRENNGY